MSGYTVPTQEPDELIAGDTWQWTRVLPSYPNTDYTLRYYLLGVSAVNAIVATAGADASTHAVTVPASTTGVIVAGAYQWIARVTETATGNIFTVDRGTFNIRQNLATATATATHNETMLAAIQATLEGRASEGMEEFTIGGRSIRLLSFTELRKAEREYAFAVWRERHPDSALPSQKVTFSSPRIEPLLPGETIIPGVLA